MSIVFKIFLRYLGAKDALKNNPFIKQSKEWQKAINQLLKMGVRAEQQALAKHGLNYVIEVHLHLEKDCNLHHQLLFVAIKSKLKLLIFYKEMKR